MEFLFFNCLIFHYNGWDPFCQYWKFTDIQYIDWYEVVALNSSQAEHIF